MDTETQHITYFALMLEIQKLELTIEHELASNDPLLELIVSCRIAINDKRLALKKLDYLWN